MERIIYAQFSRENLNGSGVVCCAYTSYVKMIKRRAGDLQRDACCDTETVYSFSSVYSCTGRQRRRNSVRYMHRNKLVCQVCVVVSPGYCSGVPVRTVFKCARRRLPINRCHRLSPDRRSWDTSVHLCIVITFGFYLLQVLRVLV